MNEELQERYIYAVVRRLPRKQREDIEQELRGLIADMLEARCRGLPPTEHDLRVVLAELGTPRELYRKYSPDAGRSLIGPAYYARYRQVLRVVLGCTALGLTFALLLVQVGEGFVQPWYAVLGGWLAALWQGEAVAFAVVTAVFALLERKGVRVEGDEGLDSLPPVPKKRGAIPWGEPVADIVFAVLLAAFLLSAPDWLCILWVEGQPLPVLDAAVVRGRWGLVVGISVAGVVGGCLKLLEGRRTRRLAWGPGGLRAGGGGPELRPLMGRPDMEPGVAGKAGGPGAGRGHGAGVAAATGAHGAALPGAGLPGGGHGRGVVPGIRL